MFVRVSGKKGFEYVYLCRSVRAGKTIKQEIVEKLGKLSDLTASDPDALKKLKEKYAGVSADEKLKKDILSQQTKASNLTSALEWSSEHDKGDANPYPLLCYGLEPLRALWRNDLKLERTILNLQAYNSKCEFDLNRAVFYLAGCKVLDPRSVNDAYSARTGFISQPLEDISRNNLYAALSFLSKHKDTIVRNLSRRTHEITGRKNTMMFYDVTNVYFETPLSDEEQQLFNDDEKLRCEAFKLITDYCREHNLLLPSEAKVKDNSTLELDAVASFLDKDDILIYEKIPSDLQKTIRQKLFLRMSGRSKEHRSDLPLVSIALVIDEFGFPLDYEIYSGCSSEFNTMKQSIDNLKNRYGIKDAVIVADRGLNSVANLKMLQDMKFGFLVAQKISTLSSEYSKYLKSPESMTSEDYDEWEETEGLNIPKEQYRFKVFKDYKKTVKQPKSHGGKTIEITCSLVVSFSQERYLRDRKLLEIDHQKALNAITSKQHISSSLKSWQRLVSTENHKGNIAASFKQDIYEQRLRECGYAAVVYKKAPDSEHDLTSQELGKAYHRQVRIEECFRILKSNVQLRPMYVYTPEHIRGHILCCFISLLLFRLMEFKLKQNGTPMSIENISYSLSGAKVLACRIGDEILFLHTNDYLTGSRLQNCKKSGSVTEGGLAINNIMEVAGLKPLLNVNSYHSLNNIFSRKKSSALEFIDPELHNVI